MRRAGRKGRAGRRAAGREYWSRKEEPLSPSSNSPLSINAALSTFRLCSCAKSRRMSTLRFARASDVKM